MQCTRRKIPLIEESLAQSSSSSTDNAKQNVPQKKLTLSIGTANTEIRMGAKRTKAIVDEKQKDPAEKFETRVALKRVKLQVS